METANYGESVRRAKEGALSAVGCPLGAEAVEEAAARLLRLTPAQQRMSLSGRRPSNAILVLRRLLRDGYQSRHSLPSQYHAAAAAAARLAARLPSRGPYRRVIEDLRAEAWAHLGNTRRIAEDLPAADRAFARAELHRDRGTDDLHLRAGILRLKAPLRRDQSRLADALAALAEAVALYTVLQEGRLAARAKLNLGLVYLYSGDPAAAYPLTVQAAQAVSPGDDPAFALGALHNLALCVAEAGRIQRALGLFTGLLPLYAASGDRVLQVRVAWVIGRVLAHQKDWKAAAEAFDLVRTEFTNRGLAFDAALAGLELALAHLQLGRTAEVRALAEEMLPVFVAQQIPREASAALLLFVEAARREALSADAVARLVADLKGRLAPAGRRGSQGRFIA